MRTVVSSNRADQQAFCRFVNKLLNFDKLDAGIFGDLIELIAVVPDLKINDAGLSYAIAQHKESLNTTKRHTCAVSGICEACNAESRMSHFEKYNAEESFVKRSHFVI